MGREDILKIVFWKVGLFEENNYMLTVVKYVNKLDYCSLPWPADKPVTTSQVDSAKVGLLQRPPH